MWKGREGRRKTEFLTICVLLITSRYKLVRAIKWVDEVNNTLYGAGNFRGVKFLWMDHQLTFRGFIFTDERVLPIVSVLDDAKIKPFENFQLYIQYFFLNLVIVLHSFPFPSVPYMYLA